jgi:hypothetical protein
MRTGPVEASTIRQWPPSESLNRVPPSETIGDTRVRAAPYRLLNREGDGWGQGNGKTFPVRGTDG